MDTVFNEISTLRNGLAISIDYNNSNKYCLVSKEPDGSKTAYYFSTPIYNCKTRKLLNLRFSKNCEAISLLGSNAKILVNNAISMKNSDGSLLINLNSELKFLTEKELSFKEGVVFPTTNGIAIKTKIRKGENFSFLVKVNHPFMNIRSNNKYFSLMSEQFRPFFTVSTIGTLNTNGNLVAPAKISYQRIDDKKYKLIVSPTSPLGAFMLFEINMYDEKLVQDTTVESLNPTENNAFGSTAFIGNTSAFGRQWLYSRVDYSKISEIMNKHINKAILHIPSHNKGLYELSAFNISSRFCSFGSNWDNKIAQASFVSDTYTHNGYKSIDITSLLTHPQTHTIIRSEGLILKPAVKASGFSAIATGDSYYTPQIFEINFR